MTIWNCRTHVRMTSSVERTDLDFKISVALFNSIVQLFHVCLENSQNYCPKVPWTAWCTIALSLLAVVLSIPPNSHEITVLLPNKCRKCQLNWHAKSVHAIILMMFDVINEATDKTIACCFCMMFKWVISWVWYSRFCWLVGDVIYATLHVCAPGPYQLSFS